MLHRSFPWVSCGGRGPRAPWETGPDDAQRHARLSPMLALVAQAGMDNWPPEGKLAAAVLVMMAVGGLLSRLVDEVASRD